MDSDDAKKALEQMNGFELAGRPMKVGNVTERADSAMGAGGGHHPGANGSGGAGSAGNGLDVEEMDRAGIDLGATGRLALMAKLAEGTGMKLPEVRHAQRRAKKTPIF